MPRTIGICLGASTVSVAEGTDGDMRLSRISHDGQVAGTIRSVLGNGNAARIGVTGRKFRRVLSVPTISEPEAVELAFEHVRHRYPDVNSVVSAGGEAFIVYSLDARGKIHSVHTGNRCASGTGEFFLQQVERMGLSVEDALRLASGSDPYRVAARCSVFCKSDCTHALNKGVDKGRVAAGLARMLAGKITELLRSAQSQGVLLVGGVSLNPLVAEYVRETYPETYIPEEAPCFEALGALLWARKNAPPVRPGKKFFRSRGSSFSEMPSLTEGLSRVTFLDRPRGEFHHGEYLLGLDVGSTTTKAVLVRTDTRAVVASVYLRTDGDPVGASRACYRELQGQLPAGFKPDIIGLGVTGSGRQIAGLHALTDTVVNEIVAHKAAAVHFDPEVDTIFEIGGQDAKYTTLTNGTPTDYAMNEACSAGTGSFLEEACGESFGVKPEEIADVALQSLSPPDFNDQCAAFIGSDVKTAMQEGLGREDIVAGLVYSVCRNYLSRVKGNRWTGKKIFLQGGVCYNRAVPMAMAVLCERDVIVPPEPGLMGALGAALQTMEKIGSGLARRGSFDLQELADREIRSLSSFVCAGEGGACDRKCTVNRYRVNGRVFPFGGACDRYVNLRMGKKIDTAPLDLVRVREDLVHRRYAPSKESGIRSTVGIPCSLMTNTLYPLYAHFFSNLGFEVVKGVTPIPDGTEEAGAAFCLPLLESHGQVRGLIDGGVDRVFIPHVESMPPADGEGKNITCPLVQGEPYVLGSAFHRELSERMVTGVLDFSDLNRLRRAFQDIGTRLGRSRRRSGRAFEAAWRTFTALDREMREKGRALLGELDAEETAVVLFGRPYNAFTGRTNLGIPGKFASRGHRIIPHDLLPAAKEMNTSFSRMYWASGQTILRAARFVGESRNLFGAYITNFNCGPDSLILEQFRNVMGEKPFLILELDAHTADAGLDTRIEAFLDVIEGYRKQGPSRPPSEPFVPARTELRDGNLVVRTGSGEGFDITHPRVLILFPSMGEMASRGMAAAMSYVGVRSTAAPPPGRLELALGREEASGKECLPLTLTTGTLKRYLKERADNDEVLIYFMPEADGPCRFGQYSVFLKDMVRKNQLENVAVFSPTCEDGYSGLPANFPRRALLSVAISDGLDDLQAGILTLAADRDGALDRLSEVMEAVFSSVASDEEDSVLDVLKGGMSELAALERVRPVDEATSVLLTGEIYVRRDDFSRLFLVHRLAEEGILVRTAPILEWISYVENLIFRGLIPNTSISRKLSILLRNRFSMRMHSQIQGILEQSGFYRGHQLDVGHLMDRGGRLIDPRLTGEAILTVGSTLEEIGDKVHGVISIGPFGCMPCRIAESVLHHRLEDEKAHFSKENGAFWETNRHRFSLPFLTLETDGKPLSQVNETKLENFIRSAHRLKEELAEVRRGS